VQCVSCSNLIQRFEPFLDLSLDLTDALSLEETLYNFIKIEKIEHKCGKCSKSEAIKQLKINKVCYCKRQSSFSKINYLFVKRRENS
jgi:ubiquitin carboxyl-terminal hydrolase 36/42